MENREDVDAGFSDGWLRLTQGGSVGEDSIILMSPDQIDTLICKVLELRLGERGEHANTADVATSVLTAILEPLEGDSRLVIHDLVASGYLRLADKQSIRGVISRIIAAI